MDETGREADPLDDEGRLLSADDLSRAFAQLMSDETDDSTSGSNEFDDNQDIDDSAETDPELPPEAIAVSPKAIVEACLFVGHPKNEPLSNRIIAGLMRGVSPGEVDDLIGELNAEYQQQNSPYQILSEGKGYRMALRREFASIRESFYGKLREAQLSQGAVDTLAIVAYQQPIERKRIDKLRGTATGSVLNQLVRRQLLSVEVVNERPRQFIYRTTDRFLEMFGLESLKDLPHGDDFLAD